MYVRTCMYIYMYYVDIIYMYTYVCMYTLLNGVLVRLVYAWKHVLYVRRLFIYIFIYVYMHAYKYKLDEITLLLIYVYVL